MVFLRTLGGLSLRGDDAPLPASALQRRRLALLVLLDRAGAGGLSRDTLHAWLWPESSTARARHALDQLVYATRRDLGHGAIVAEGIQLRLDPAAVLSDCGELEARLARGDTEGAVALYAGPFLDGVHLGGAAELERWADAERMRLEVAFLAALDQLAREARERGDLAAAVGWWRRRAAAEPLSPRAALGLMQALADSGDWAGAILWARTHEALVREELGAEPDARVVALAERLGRERAVTRDRAAPPPASEPEIGAASPAAARQRRGWRPKRRVAAALVGATGLALALGGEVWSRGPRASDEAAAPAVLFRSVAVLPFDDISADGQTEYLAEGMSEELIHALAQVPELRVSARTSSFAFEGRREDVREIARALGVSAVVEGSVRREGERLRVTAQLIDASTGYHMWSGTFDRRMDDALAVQEEIAHSLVRTLRPRLTTGEAAGGASPRPSARAYHLYLQGRYAWNQRSESSLRSAIAFFEGAIAEQPSYAAAYAGLADAHDALADAGFAPAEPSYRAAEAAARTAIRLDSTAAEAHAALGHIRFHRWDWAGAERSFRRALELNPGYAATYRYHALPLVMQGRFDEGLAMMRHAQDLDPLALQVHGSMGWLLFLARRYHESVDQLRAVVAMDSTLAPAHARLGASLVASGAYDAGIAALERAVRLDGGFYRSSLPMLGYAYATAGRAEDAERIRARVERELENRSINPYYAAALMAALGRKDRAFSLLDDAYRTNRGCLIDIGVDPAMDPLRSDPRYAALVRNLGLKPAGGESS